MRVPFVEHCQFLRLFYRLRHTVLFFLQSFNVFVSLQARSIRKGCPPGILLPDWLAAAKDRGIKSVSTLILAMTASSPFLQDVIQQLVFCICRGFTLWLWRSYTIPSCRWLPQQVWIQHRVWARWKTRCWLSVGYIQVRFVSTSYLLFVWVPNIWNATWTLYSKHWVVCFLSRVDDFLWIRHSPACLSITGTWMEQGGCKCSGGAGELSQCVINFNWICGSISEFHTDVKAPCLEQNG